MASQLVPLRGKPATITQRRSGMRGTLGWTHRAVGMDERMHGKANFRFPASHPLQRARLCLFTKLTGSGLAGTWITRVSSRLRRRRPMWRRVALALSKYRSNLTIVCTALIGVACSDKKPPAQASINVSTRLGPGDSLARLSRLLLTDSNPHAIGQAITCENVRLIRIYGGVRAARITAEVRDTIYRSTDEAAFRRVDAILANNVFDLSCGYPPGRYPKPTESDSLR